MRGTVFVDTARIPERFRALGGAISPNVTQAVYRTGALYRTSVRAGASGRPGPRARTGDYRRRIGQTNTFDRGVAVALISTNAPQAARLEYGFVGVDALGRRFNQPPYPHWAPAAVGLDVILETEIRASVEIALSQIWRR